MVIRPLANGEHGLDSRRADREPGDPSPPIKAYTYPKSRFGDEKTGTIALTNGCSYARGSMI